MSNQQATQAALNGRANHGKAAINFVSVNEERSKEAGPGHVVINEVACHDGVMTIYTRFLRHGQWGMDIDCLRTADLGPEFFAELISDLTPVSTEEGSRLLLNYGGFADEYEANTRGAAA